MKLSTNGARSWAALGKGAAALELAGTKRGLGGAGSAQATQSGAKSQAMGVRDRGIRASTTLEG